MKRNFSRWPILATLTLAPLALTPFTASMAHAQSSSSGTVTGVVTDQTGALVVGATVTLTNVTTKTNKTVVTNSKGAYTLVDVPPDTYNITASKPGFATDAIYALAVAVGAQTNASFKMSVGAESTTVEVQANNADLQTMSASTGTTVDPALVESLPAIGRDVATFATMQPGVTPGGMVAGTTADQATFQLDGGSNSSDMDGTQGVYTDQQRQLHGTGGFIAGGPGGVVPMPQDSIEEFKVSTSGQTADFNNSSGSQSQIVTKRGRDKVHGTVYEYYLDNNFNGNTLAEQLPRRLYSQAQLSLQPLRSSSRRPNRALLPRRQDLPLCQL